MKELWKDIPGYESHYQVSNLGRIRSLDRVIAQKNGVIKNLKGLVKSPVLNDNGYFTINLYKSGKAKCVKIHREIAIAFIERDSKYNCVNHKDGVKTNNSIDNLEWCNHSENNQHAFDIGLRKPPKTTMAGSCHARYISDIKGTSIETGETIILAGAADIIAKGFCSRRVYKCVNGTAKTHKGYTFKRVEK